MLWCCTYREGPGLSFSWPQHRVGLSFQNSDTIHVETQKCHDQHHKHQEMAWCISHSGHAPNHTALAKTAGHLHPNPDAGTSIEPHSCMNQGSELQQLKCQLHSLPKQIFKLMSDCHKLTKTLIDKNIMMWK